MNSRTDKAVFKYQADDGYVGKDRPLRVSIPIEEILQCDSDEDAAEMVEEIIEEDFQQRVTASYSHDVILEEVARIRAQHEEGQDQES